MQHIHLTTTNSTQTAVKEALSQGSENLLVSTDFQESGVGRQGAPWSHFEDALAFSFDIVPNSTITLTPLEMGVLLARFFSPTILLKWPNDLINQQKEKVGGILCQLVGKRVVVGIGLNLNSPKELPQFDYPVGSIFSSNEQLRENYKRELPIEVCEFIKKNRLSPDEVRAEFTKHCVHMNQRVSIINGEDKKEGEFCGLADNGEALLKIEDTLHKVMTGSLRFN